MFDRILTALDGSEYSERALSHTRDVAIFAGSEVHLLSVVPTQPSAHSSAAAPAEEHQGRPFVAYLKQKASALREAGIDEVHTHVRFGDPARLIAEAAKEQRIDLVVMSTQGLGADGRYGLGSVALKVLMTAPCPILMVRINPPEPAKTAAEERWQTEGGANVG